MKFVKLSAMLAPICLVFCLAGPSQAGQVYLALGDSLAFGVGADGSLGDVSNGDRGFVSLYADRLGSAWGTRPDVLNLAISGETSSSFFSGVDRNGPTASPLRNTNYVGLTPVPTQQALLQSRLAAEAAAGNTIGHVTISLGSNDLFVLQASAAFQAADLNGKILLLQQTLGVIQTNYLTLLGGLRAALPTVQIDLLGTYNPFGTATPDAALANQGILALNSLISGIAGGFGPGVDYVDIYTPFVGNELTYTYIANGNVHPTSAGYAAIAQAIPMDAVPEPSSLALFAIGVVAGGHVVIRRRSRRAA